MSISPPQLPHGIQRHTRGMSVDPLRRAPCLTVEAALGMRTKPETLHQLFDVRVHGYTE